MIRKLLAIFILSVFCSSISASGLIERWYPYAIQEPVEISETGFIDLSQWNDKSKIPALLSNSWEFYWNRVLTNRDFAEGTAPEPDAIVQSQHFWSQYREENPFPNHGFGTYRLPVRLPDDDTDLAVLLFRVGSAYNIYWNDQLIASMGTFGTHETRANGKRGQIVAQLPADAKEGNIIIHVSNYQFPSGGLLGPVILGSDQQLFDVLQGSSIQIFFMFGFFIVMGIYHVFLFIFRSEDKTPIYFALICFALSVRILVAENNELFQIIANIDLELTLSLEYLTFTNLVAFFSLFISSLFSFSVNRFVNYFAMGISAIYSTFIIIAPAKIFTQFLIVYQIFTLLIGTVLLSLIIAAIVRKDRGAILFGLGFLIVFSTAIIDMFFADTLFPTISISPYGILIFVLMQAIMLTRNRSLLIKEVRALNIHLQEINQSTEKFVPKAFLQHLDKTELRDIGLGDYKELSMTVLFADIRKFSTIAEKSVPREIFSYLNEFLSQMGPQIRRNFGFVDKYLGDGIMALFPRKPEDAIQAAIDMQKTLDKFNTEIKEEYNSFNQIKMGIGIHSGDLILGTIGEEERMDTTVIADAVNLAARLEELCRHFQSKILISGETEAHLAESSEIYRRSLGIISLRGKLEKTKLFEVYDSDQKDQIELKKQYNEHFEEAIGLWSGKKYPQAKALLSKLEKLNPKDGAIKYYLTSLAKSKTMA